MSTLVFNRASDNYLFHGSEFKAGSSLTKLRLSTVNNETVIDLCNNGNIDISGTLFVGGQELPSGSNTVTLTGNQTITGDKTLSGTTTISNADTITATGTITSGTWNATPISTVYGGTGLTSHGSSGQILVSTGSGFQMQNIDGGTYS